MRKFAISAINPQGKIVGFVHSDGAPNAKELIGHNAWEFVKDVTSVQNAVTRCLIHGESSTFEATCSTGEHEHWQSQIFPTPNAAAVIHAHEVWQTVDHGYLSTEDRHLLCLLANDLTPKQIADTLGISDRALRSRLAHLRERCHVKTNCGLVAWAFRYGVA